MNTYIYHGPVYKFETCIDPNWEAVTSAKSKAKALNNLRYRVKKELGLIPSTKIILFEEYLQKEGE